MIFQIFIYGFAALALLSFIGAWLKRAKRMPFLWAAASATAAALGAKSAVAWTVLACGPMAFWALFTTLPWMTMTWRMRTGFAFYLVVGAALSLYPTYHDEMICGDRVGAEAPPSCPSAIAALDAEEREKVAAAAAAGDRGFRPFLLSSVSYRLVRGLDLKGGLRLVYTVDVEEAIKDRRDRYYDDLRAKLTRAYGFVEGDETTVDDMQKLREVVKMGRPRSEVDTITLTFNNPEDSSKHLNNAFLASFLNELRFVRSADGAKVTFQMRNTVETEIRTSAVTQAKETILRRIDGMGVKEAAVSVRDEDVIVEIPGKDDKSFQEIRDIISRTARLEFKLLDDEANFFEPYVQKSGDELPTGLSFLRENAPLGPGRTQPNVYGRLSSFKGESMEEALKRFREWSATLNVDEDHEIGFGKIYEVNEDSGEYEAVGWRTFYLKAKAELTGDMIREARAQPDQSDTGLGGWNVSMQMTPRGGELFEKITGDNVKRRFAIILDGKVESAPVIEGRIPGGNARITMGGGGLEQQLQDARMLELVLRSGALPAPISPSNEQRIGPSLGKDSIDQGVKAASMAAILVLVLMVLYYGRAGFIANIAVLFNLTLQMSVLSMFSASMTLPGIAGLALTIGVAVDANVLINERIREELRDNKSARAAVSAGYDKAFSAIIDGHATTLISGLILAQYGTGPIKGFAVTLIIGMITSLFTGVVITRLLFDLWLRGRRDMKLKMG